MLLSIDADSIADNAEEYLLIHSSNTLTSVDVEMTYGLYSTAYKAKVNSGEFWPYRV